MSAQKGFLQAIACSTTIGAAQRCFTKPKPPEDSEQQQKQSKLTIVQAALDSQSANLIQEEHIERVWAAVVSLFKPLATGELPGLDAAVKKEIASYCDKGGILKMLQDSKMQVRQPLPPRPSISP